MEGNTLSSDPNPEKNEGAGKKSIPLGKKILKIVGKIFWQGKIFPAFWTITSIFSLVVNIILIVILFTLSNHIFTLKRIIRDDLLAGFYSNFMLMDDSRIQTEIEVNTKVPAKFDLPLETDTVVTLTEDTHIPGASVKLSTGGLTIDAPADIWLPANTELPVHLSLVVPVDQQIPVNLNVNVDIPLNETDLHKPFQGLQTVLEPYYALLWNLPESWQEAICGNNPSLLCENIIP